MPTATICDEPIGAVTSIDQGKRLPRSDCGSLKMKTEGTGKTFGRLRHNLSQLFHWAPNARAGARAPQASGLSPTQPADPRQGARAPESGGGDPEPGEPGSGAPDPDTVYIRASFCQFSALFGLLLWAPTRNLWIPIGHLAGPILVWLGTRRTAPFTDRAGREAINFQLNMSAYGAVLVLLGYHFFLLSQLVLTLVLVDIALVIVAGVKVSRGESYRYPLICYRLLR